MPEQTASHARTPADLVRIQSREALRLLLFRQKGRRAHEALRVRSDADKKAMKDAYLRLLLLVHPDKVGNAAPEWVRHACIEATEYLNKLGGAMRGGRQG